MILCRNITVRYREAAPALSTVSLHLAAGEMAALLGPNGSGKTTLLRCIAGSLAPESGDSLVKGDRVRSLSHKERARRIAFVPQRPETVPDLILSDMALMGRFAHKGFLEAYSDADRAVARRCLEETDLARLAARPVGTLSGGELQRAYAARAFAQQAPVLLLDEAAAGLDPAHALAVFEHVRRRNRETGVTVLAAIHDLNLAALYCPRLIFLRQGRIVADGSARDVFTPAILEQVYGTPFLVVDHPANGVPQAMALPEECRA